MKSSSEVQSPVSAKAAPTSAPWVFRLYRNKLVHAFLAENEGCVSTGLIDRSMGNNGWDDSDTSLLKRCLVVDSTTWKIAMSRMGEGLFCGPNGNNIPSSDITSSSALPEGMRFSEAEEVRAIAQDFSEFFSQLARAKGWIEEDSEGDYE